MSRSRQKVRSNGAPGWQFGGKDLRGRLLPHAGLIAQTLIFLGAGGMHVTVGVDFASPCHSHLELIHKRAAWRIVGRLEVEANA